MKKIIRLLLISIKDYLHKAWKLKLICNVIHSRIRNEIYKTKNISQKAVKFVQFFHEHASTLPYYTRVKFE